MTLEYILIFILIAAVLGLVLRNRARVPVLLTISMLAVFALQPALPVRGLDFWLPTATLGLCVLGWVLTTPREARSWRANWLTIVILCGGVLALGLTRFLGISLPLTASRPPQFFQVIIALSAIALAAFLLWYFSHPTRLLLAVAFVFVIILFLFLKVPALAGWASGVLRGNLTGWQLPLTCAGWVFPMSPSGCCIR